MIATLAKRNVQQTIFLISLVQLAALAIGVLCFIWSGFGPTLIAGGLGLTFIILGLCFPASRLQQVAYREGFADQLKGVPEDDWLGLELEAEGEADKLHLSNEHGVAIRRGPQVHLHHQDGTEYVLPIPALRFLKSGSSEMSGAVSPVSLEGENLFGFTLCTISPIPGSGSRKTSGSDRAAALIDWLTEKADEIDG